MGTSHDALLLVGLLLGSHTVTVQEIQQWFHESHCRSRYLIGDEIIARQQLDDSYSLATFILKITQKV